MNGEPGVSLQGPKGDKGEKGLPGTGSSEKGLPHSIEMTVANCTKGNKGERGYYGDKGDRGDKGM